VLVWLKSRHRDVRTVAGLVPELVTRHHLGPRGRADHRAREGQLAGAAFKDRTRPRRRLPVRLTVVVMPPALTVRFPVRLPVAVGETPR